MYVARREINEMVGAYRHHAGYYMALLEGRAVEACTVSSSGPVSIWGTPGTFS